MRPSSRVLLSMVAYRGATMAVSESQRGCSLLSLRRQFGKLRAKQMAGRLQDKVAIITGASRGLGQYVAVGYAKEDAKVVIAARTETESNPQLPGTIYHTAKLVEEAGGEAFPVVCNVADAESIEAMTKQVLDKWGRIDIVMPNAAVQPPGTIGSIQPRHWELEFRI